MSAYNFNSDLCLEVFHQIVEEIPSGVRREHLIAVYPKIKFTQELLSFIRNTITTISKNAINFVWTHFKIPEKLKHLGELEEKSPKTETRRPKTGNVNPNYIVAKHLLRRKTELIKQIELVREESAMITAGLTEFSEIIKGQMEEMDTIQKKYD